MMENDGTHAADNYQYWVPNLETISVPTIIKTGDTCKIPACFLDWSFENAGAIGHSNFTNVDLTGLEQATEIGSHFVKNTNLMKKIDLNPLRNVTKVGTYFLGYNHSLTTLYLSAMKKLETIEGAFLEKSTKIKSIDLTALSKMKTIPGQFMLGCDGLEIADFSNFVNLGSESSEGIQGRFMAYCSGLKVLYLPNKDPNTYTIVSGELLQNVPTSCVIHCGDYLQQYKSHDV